MTDLSNISPASESSNIRRCNILRRAVLDGSLSVDDYVNSVTLACVPADQADMEKCVATIPENLLFLVYQHLVEKVISVNYMPDPGHFVIPGCSDEIYTKMKLHLKPRYQQLVSLIQSRLE